MSKKRIDPRKLAIRLVDEWFDAITSSHDGHNSTYTRGQQLSDAFGNVEVALEAEELAEYGAASDDEDAAIRKRIASTEAGYLIGVQVGLRLRR